MNPALQLQLPAAGGEFELMPHPLHTPPGRENVPATHAEQLVLATTDENPAGHTLHALFPMDLLYLPDAHGLQDLPLCSYPILHRHCVQLVLAFGE